MTYTWLGTSRAHSLNDSSSRSHSVFTVTLRHRSGSMSRLSLVDLAGSERVKSTEASGVALKEAIHINSSLSTLSDCVRALQANTHGTRAKPVHVPYRNSKLTTYLSDSLRGHSKALYAAAHVRVLARARQLKFDSPQSRASRQTKTSH